MSDHLPECIYAPRNVDPKKGIEWGGQPCICYALRACEQRVREEWYEVQSETWEQGFKYALDAVREAIVALPTFEKPYPWCGDVQHCGGDDSVELNAVLDIINVLQDKS